ncbi:MAG: tetratricopeptide repeat protein [Fidelibacterota bacterium]
MTSPQEGKFPTRDRVFKAVAVLIPVLLLVLAEGVLRIVSYGKDLRLFVPDRFSPGYLTVNPSVGHRYFSGPSAAAFGTHDVFKKEKGASTLRVVALGGSTTAGYPYLYSGSFPAMVKDRLVQAYPGVEIEMINLGMTAVTSYAVLDFVEDVLDRDPDLLILYTGHNEFYGALGSASTQRVIAPGPLRRPLTLLTLKLKHLKTFQLAESLLRSLAPPPDQTGTLMARMAREKAVPYNSPLREYTRKTFEKNLRTVIKKAQRKKIPVLIGTLVSNLADQPPFVSLHQTGSDTLTVNRLLAQATQELNTGNYRNALTLTEKALTLDSTFALTHFLQGRALQALDRIPQAREAYRKARDTDALPFRAGSPMNTILKKVSQSPGTFLVDLEDTLQNASPNGLIDRTLMLEHLHPNLKGYFLMARAVAHTILKENLLHPNTPPQPPKPDAWFQTRIAVTPLDTAIARYRTQILTSGWPFKKGRRFLTIHDLEPGSRVDSVALAVLSKESNYERGHVFLAETYKKEGRIDDAIREYRALAATFPNNESPFLELGRLLVNSRRFDEALPVLERGAQLSDDPFSYKWAGTLLVDRGEPARGIPYLQKALELAPADGQVMFNLSGAYYLTGSLSRAIEQVETLLSLYPDFPDARRFHDDLVTAAAEKKE